MVCICSVFSKSRGVITTLSWDLKAIEYRTIGLNIQLPLEENQQEQHHLSPQSSCGCVLESSQSIPTQPTSSFLRAYPALLHLHIESPESQPSQDLSYPAEIQHSSAIKVCGSIPGASTSHQLCVYQTIPSSACECVGSRHSAIQGKI